MLKRFPDNHQNININEQEFQYISLQTKKDGDFLITDEINYSSFTILPGLYRSTNNKAIVAIQNISKCTQEINLNQVKIDNDPFDLMELPTQIDPINYNFRDDHMNNEEKEALQEVIKQNKEVLYTESDKLSFTHKIKHKIRTTDCIPVHTKSYKYPYAFENEVQEQVRKMLNDGIIKESISPYTSPVWVVPKKTDAIGRKKFRLVIDYRKLNEKNNK